MLDQETFSHEEYQRVYPKGIENHFWNAARNDLIYGLVKNHLGEGELVLDLGCGTGVTVGYLKARGVNVRGVELGAAPIIPGLESIIATETELSELDVAVRQKVKLVMLLDVLEHVSERAEFLEQIADALPNCTMILLTVPARGELWSSYDEHWGHHLRYTRPTLEKELIDGGWQAQRSFYFFHWLYWASLLLGKLGVKRATDFQSIGDNSPALFFHKVLGWTTRLETRIVPGFVVGSSIAALARRTSSRSAG